MPLLQIIYSSTAVKDFREVELSLILLDARKRNLELGVTGLLLYHDRAFLQVLEGEDDTVRPLFTRIGKDRRHENVVTLRRGPIAAREFEAWAMGFATVKGIASELPGYTDYLRHRHEPAAAGGPAAQLLAQFRHGQFRRYVEL